MSKRLLAGVVAAVCLAPAAWGNAPSFATNTCAVTLNGARVGSDLTPGNSSLRNTIAYEPSTRLYHFWGFIADDPAFPSAASSLRAVLHATSTDGIHFTGDSNMSYAAGSVDYHAYGADIDPPLDFFRAAFDSASGTWKLFNWTENDQVSNPSFGQYNYNTSVNDLGTAAGTTSVLHQGPLASPYAGNHVGAFGLVDGNLYLRIDAGPQDGGAAQLPYTDGMPPSASNALGEANLFDGTPYCWGLDPNCGVSDPRIPAYVHNVGRTLRQMDGSLGTYYTFRHWDGSRADRQIWYVESDDDGATWSQPAGIFADGSAVTIDLQPLDDANGSADFSNVDVVESGGRYRTYFSTQDAAGSNVFVVSRSEAADTIMADPFDGCSGD
ncbi:MAG TPA: hypothetical protein VH082_10190 [Rudaea sp.]|jgi:hypothetical protein|nr:hypothetical protein [Rudaea sp.]